MALLAFVLTYSALTLFVLAAFNYELSPMLAWVLATVVTTISSVAFKVVGSFLDACSSAFSSQQTAKVTLKQSPIAALGKMIKMAFWVLVISVIVVILGYVGLSHLWSVLMALE